MYTLRNCLSIEPQLTTKIPNSFVRIGYENNSSKTYIFFVTLLAITMRITTVKIIGVYTTPQIARFAIPRKFPINDRTAVLNTT
jgi:hypothetical protein